VETKLVRLDTSDRKFVDLSTEVRSFCSGRGDGLLNVFVPHSTVGLAVIEMGSSSDIDLEEALERLLPREDRYYRHAHGSSGHGADHLLPALLSPSLTLPVEAGAPLLGVWQSIVLVDLNRDNPERQVRLSFFAG
jgi:secondary thiamine-phosphate synthase enzyme